MWKGIIQSRPISDICLRDAISRKHKVEYDGDHLSINSVALLDPGLISHLHIPIFSICLTLILHSFGMLF